MMENSLISGPPLTVDDRYAKKCLTSVFIPPEIFIYLDKHGYIQNDIGIPILYHVPRDYPKKQIVFDPQNVFNFVYNTDIPERDIPKRVKMKKLYWWHQENLLN